MKRENFGVEKLIIFNAKQETDTWSLPRNFFQSFFLTLRLNFIRKKCVIIRALRNEKPLKENFIIAQLLFTSEDLEI